MATVCTPKVKRAQSAKSMGFCLNYVKDRRKTEMANGISTKHIQEWLGHSDFSTTANIYAHLEYDTKLQSAEMMAKVIGNDED